MYPSNVVVLRGRVTAEPSARSLPSGRTVTQIELTTACDGTAVSVPVVVDDRAVTCAGGDEVVVVGHVRRRFFRAGGVTQSRTEVVARDVIPATRRKAVGRLVAGAVAALAG